MEEEIKRIRVKLTECHGLAHKIIMDRPDIEQPLTFDQDKEFKKINEEAQDLINLLNVLQLKLAREKRIEEYLEEKKVKLLPQENKVLRLLYEHFPNSLNMKVMVTSLGIRRNRISEHIRSFLIASMVSYEARAGAGADGYRLTTTGFDWVEKNLLPEV